MSVGAEAGNPGSWLKVTGSAATAQAGKPITATVAVNTSGLAAGVYTGSVIAENTATSAQYPVAVTLIVTAPVTGTAACTPTQLLPVFTNLSPSFELTAAQPITIQALVSDDCGNLLTSGTVEASFSGDGDLPAGLTALGSGLWSGTWLPHSIAGAGASISLAAETVFGPASTVLAGSASVSGTLDANPSAVLISPGGIVNAASLVSGAPIAPGEYLSIFGSNLGSANATQVLLGGQAMPLQFVGPNQINALVPFEVSVNSIQELLVEVNGAYSLPETVAVAPANPAVFTAAQSGTGAGVIVIAKPDGTQVLAGPTQLATAGDGLVIYCSGLGAVSPAVPDGEPAPLSPLSRTVNPVTVTIGGQTVQPFFAGLAPLFPSVYQVNIIVPAGIAPGANVAIAVSTLGLSSAAVTVGIQ